jgi:hypothetical protein
MWWTLPISRPAPRRRSSLDAALQYSFPASDPISIEAGEPTN